MQSKLKLEEGWVMNQSSPGVGSNLGLYASVVGVR